MAALIPIEAHDTVAHLLSKREKNWAAREPGVVAVFCIVFIVVAGFLSVYISRAVAKRRAARQQ
jgi:uncharacterized membrane protein SpoIIM required for sporulation